jgi:hypothetical protein
MTRSFAIAILIFGSTIGLNAQQLEPRAYSITPIGVNIANASYGYSTGDLNFDPSLPIDEGSAQISNFVASYVRAINVGGRSANIALAVPYVWGNLQGIYLGTFTEVYRSGLTDSFARFSVNLYGAKAMNLKEFAAYRQRTNIGASVVVSAPLGQYDPAKLINVGTNRWAFKPEVGISHALKSTRLILDGYVGVWLYTANTNFQQGRKRSQEPIVNTQFHISYDIKPRMWVAFDANFFRGGQTSIDGVVRDDRQRNSRLGVTFSAPVAKRQAIRLAYSDGAITRIGGDFKTISVAYQYLWGAGL